MGGLALTPLTDDERETVAANLGLAGAFVGRFKLNHHDHDDTFQDAAVGLMRAARTHDPDKGALSTHASFWMRSATVKGSQKRTTIRLPAHVWDAMREGREPRYGDDARRALGVGSYDALDDADPPTDSAVKAVDDADERDYMLDKLRAAMATLTPLERDVIESRFWRGEQYNAIGRRHGKRRTWADGVARAALARLREYLEWEGET